MVAVGLSMLRPSSRPANESVRLTRASARHLLPRLVGLGFGVGLLAGFFGIGGGFLIVPALMLATGMALPNAIGTSLVAVTAFGLATAGSYAISGFIDWRLVVMVASGGVAGSMLGTRASAALAVEQALAGAALRQHRHHGGGCGPRSRRRAFRRRVAQFVTRSASHRNIRPDDRPPTPIKTPAPTDWRARQALGRDAAPDFYRAPGILTHRPRDAPVFLAEWRALHRL